MTQVVKVRFKLIISKVNIVTKRKAGKNLKMNPNGKEMSTHFGDRSDTGVYKVFLEKKSMFEENPLTIAIVTSIMKRAHSYSFSKDIVFADSSSSCEQDYSSAERQALKAAFPAST
ncbi:hypothetical protein ACI65C_004447 [Semiaphis heraclei]